MVNRGGKKGGGGGGHVRKVEGRGLRRNIMYMGTGLTNRRGLRQ